VRLFLLVLATIALVGCGREKQQAVPAPTRTYRGLTTLPGEQKALEGRAQEERDQWKAFTPAEGDDYRRGFEICNDLVTNYHSVKAARLAQKDIGTARNIGCQDGIAGLPLEGSGIRVLPFARPSG
jgi:hypothetical protein